ncbi:hypothetical protein H0X48_06160 [Candidatus Dependentiae bacterium]|nr:hypothetical protein [Candidatus Dependentiae bacterium]
MSVKAQESCLYNPNPTTQITGFSTSVVFSANGCLIRSFQSSINNQVLIYKPIDACSYDVANPQVINFGVNSALGLAVSPNGCLAIGIQPLEEDSTLLQMYRQTAECTYSPVGSPINLGNNGIIDAAFSPNGCLAIAYSQFLGGPSVSNAFVQIYTQESNCQYAPLGSPISVGNNTITGLAFSSNDCLAIVYNNGVGQSEGPPPVATSSAVQLYAATTSCQYSALGNPITSTANTIQSSVAFSSNGCLAIGYTDTNNNAYVQLYNQIGSCQYAPSGMPISVGSINSAGALKVAFSSANCLAVSYNTSTDLTAQIQIYAPLASCQYASASQVITAAGSNPTVAFSPTNCLAVGTNSGLNVYAPIPTEPIVTPVPTSPVRVVLCGPKCRTTTTKKPKIVGRATPGATIYLQANNKLIGKTTANSKGVFCIIPCRALCKGCNGIVAFTPNGSTMVSSNAIQIFVNCR